MHGRAWTRLEDRLLRDLSGKVPARTIALLLGRTASMVTGRRKRLGINGTLRGQYHPGQKVSDDTAAMIGALYDAGFKPKQIEGLLKTEILLSYAHIQGICQCRERLPPVA